MAINPRVIKKKPAAKKAPAKKPPSGTLTERMGEAKTRPYKGTRGGAVTRTEKPRVTGRQYSGDSIKMGQGSKGSVTKPKVVPLGDRPKLLSGPKASAGTSVAGTIAKGLWRGVGGPAAMLVSMTTEAGRGSDKPSGPLFSPSKNRAAGQGNPKTTNKYRPQGGGPMSRQGSSSASMNRPRVQAGARPEMPGSYPKAKAKVNQLEMAKKNKAARAQASAKPSVSQPQAQPMAKKRTRPLTRYQRDYMR